MRRDGQKTPQVKPRFTLDAREADAYVAKLDPRQELIYRLAFRGLCNHCLGDRAFKTRTDVLLRRFRGGDLGALLAEQIARELADL